MDKENAVIYCRIDGPVNEHSQVLIDCQKNRLTDYAYRQHFDIKGYYEDVGYSGRVLNRPGLQQLVIDINVKKIDVILVSNPDRLYRGKMPKYLRSLSAKVQFMDYSIE